MTITNNLASKLAIAFVAVAMAFTFALPAQAQDVDSMSLEDLIALVNQLQAQLSGSGSMSGSCSYTFTRSLSQGSTGADVMNLQKFLNMSADTQVAAAGAAGSPGMETSYYGPATAGAVSKFQTKYSADILVPVGLTNPTGYFGPSTMAKANMLCSTMTDGDGDGDGDNGGPLSGGAGNIEDTDFISSINNEEVREGEDDVEVLGLEVEADNNSDIELLAVTLKFEYDGALNVDFDDYVDEVTVWFDGDEVASRDADEWEDAGDTDGDTQTLSLDSGAVIGAGDMKDFVVAVSAQSNIDSTDLADSDWLVSVESIRFRDATGAVITENGVGDIDETRSFDFEDESGDEDIELRSSSDDLDAMALLVEDLDESDWHTVFIFRLEAEENDIELENLVLTASTSDIYDDVVNDIRIFIDGEEFNDVDVTDGNTSVATLDFDIDGDHTIDGDDIVDVEVEVEFRQQDGNYLDGDTFQMFTVSVSGEGADDVDDTATISGSEHTLDLSGLSITGVSSNANTNEADTTAFIDFEFTVEAEEGDVTFDVVDNADVDGATDDVRFTVLGPTPTATSSFTLISGDATFLGGTWTINEGDEATFALDSTITGDGTYRVRLDSVAGVEVDETSSSANIAP